MNLSNSNNGIGNNNGTLSTSSSYNSLSSLNNSYNNINSNNNNSNNSNSNNDNFYLPLCFSKDVFTSNTFEIDQFISDCRKRVNLESVQKDLREYSKHLDSELIELINKEYQSFFSLSTSLVGFDVILNEFSISQSSIKSEIKSFNNEIIKVRECVEDKLNEKKSIEQKKKLLQLYISISETLNNMNHLFDQLYQLTHPNEFKKNDNNNHNNDNTEVLELLIERISNSFYQIQNQMSSLSSDELKYNIFQSLSSKIKELSNKILEKIEPIFKESLKRFIHIDSSGNGNKSNEDKKQELQDEKILLSCLKTFQIIDKINVPYKLFKSLILKPKLSQIITLRNLEINKSTTDGLSQIYETILEFLKVNCSPFFNISNLINNLNEQQQQHIIKTSNEMVSTNIGSGGGNSGEITTNNYYFLSQSLLPEIEEQLTHFKQIFATGITDLFYKNYYLTFNFIQSIELLFLNSKESLNQFRTSTSYTALWKKWNFAVYFQLCFTDIATTFEYSYLNVPLFDQLSIPTTSGNSSNNNGNGDYLNEYYFLKSTDGLRKCIEKCWSNSIFIFDLSSKFFKLFLQLIARYDTFISDTLVPVELEYQQAQQAQAEQQQLENSNETITTASNIASKFIPKSPITNNTTNNNSNNIPQQQQLTNKQSSPENFIYVCSDIYKIKSKISTQYKDLIIKTIGTHQNQNEIFNIISNGILETCFTMEQLIPRMINIIVNHLISKCSEHIEFIGTLRSTYRMTNKPVPTKPSVYVSNLISPLESFLNVKCSTPILSSTIPNEIKLNLAIQVLTPITEGFKNAAGNLIQSVTQSNDILNKMVKRNKAASSITGNEVSDIDKISIQLYLDVEKFGSYISKFGIDLSTFVPFLNLKSLVEPFKKLINITPK